MHTDGFKPEISIVIPVKDEPEKTIACMSSIRANTKIPYEIIWVDNGSTEDSRRAIMVQATRRKVHTKFIALRNNLGFVKATNAGIREAENSSKYIVLLNNDTEVSYRWASKLIRPMEKNAQIAAVGPVTQSKISWQEAANLNLRWNLKMPEWSPHTNNQVYSEMLEGGFKGRHLDVGALPLAFFAVALQRAAVERVGLLDESFGIGLGDDDEYCYRLRAYGYQLHLSLDAFVFHHHRTTFRSLGLPVDKIRRHNIGVLRAKKHAVMEKIRAETLD